MTVTAGGNRRVVQRRATRRDGWTRAKRAIFLDALAASCNVTRSAAAAGMTAKSARELRYRDPAFDDAWTTAMAQGCAVLKDELLAQAAGAVVAADQPGRDEIGAAAAPAIPFDPHFAIKVLRMLGEAPAGSANGGEGGRRGQNKASCMTLAEVDQAILTRLAAITRHRDRT